MSGLNVNSISSRKLMISVVRKFSFLALLAAAPGPVSSALGCENIRGLFNAEKPDLRFLTVLKSNTGTWSSLVSLGERTNTPEIFTGIEGFATEEGDFLGSWLIDCADPASESDGDVRYSRGISHFSHLVMLKMSGVCYLGWYRKKLSGPDSLELTPVQEVSGKGFILGGDILNPLSPEHSEECSYTSEWKVL